MKRADQARWFLRRWVEGGGEWSTALQAVPFRVGRLDKADLQLDSEKVSKWHAEFVVEGGELWIRDLNSTNGTFVNGRPVQTKVPLEEGDIVHFADEQFEVVTHDPPKSLDGQTSETRLSSGQPMGRPPRAVRETRRFLLLLHHRAVKVLFQPLIRLENGALLGYEALGRGDYPGAPNSPAKLFEIAERLGRASELSRAMRARALQKGPELPLRPSADRPVLFVNTHPLEINDCDALLESLSEFRDRETSLPVVLEIHESAVTDISTFRHLREQLDKLDIGLAFDDFGTGQARLRELCAVHPDYVKFDLEFARNLHEASETTRKMVEGLVKMMRSINVRSIVEGVEAADEAKACTDLGFEYGQGYYFGPPTALVDLSR